MEVVLVLMMALSGCSLVYVAAQSASLGCESDMSIGNRVGLWLWAAAVAGAAVVCIGQALKVAASA